MRQGCKDGNNRIYGFWVSVEGHILRYAIKYCSIIICLVSICVANDFFGFGCRLTRGEIQKRTPPQGSKKQKKKKKPLPIDKSSVEEIPIAPVSISTIHNVIKQGSPSYSILVMFFSLR